MEKVKKEERKVEAKTGKPGRWLEERRRIMFLVLVYKKKRER